MRDNPEEVILASKEHRGDWARVRRASLRGKLSDTEGRSYLWVRVDPPVIGQTYGLGQDDITDLLLSPHFEGDSLFPISKFPTHVYIYRSTDNSITPEQPLSRDTLILEAWGELYETRDQAEEALSSDEYG